MLKIVYAILGIKGYIQLRYAIKKIKKPDYEFKLLNETNLYRFGDQFQASKGVLNFRYIVDVVSRWNHKGIILMYHRVTNLESDPWQLNVTPNRFEEHIQVLKKYGRLVRFREIVKNRKCFSLGKKEITITFDDGYVDNFINAKPILERYGIPATFFIISEAVGSRKEFWWDELERIILTPINLPSSFQMSIAGAEYCWSISSKANSKIMPDVPPNRIMISKTQLYFALWHIFSQVSFQEKWHYLQQIALWAKNVTPPRDSHLPMNSQELSALAQSPLFEIGAHTRCHPMLSKLPRENQLEEISGSKQDLEKMFNIPIKTFSYPHGDYSDTTVQLIKECGFDCACTVNPELLTHDSDVYRLPRFNVLNWDRQEFENRIISWLK